MKCIADAKRDGEKKKTKQELNLAKGREEQKKIFRYDQSNKELNYFCFLNLRNFNSK